MGKKTDGRLSELAEKKRDSPRNYFPRNADFGEKVLLYLRKISVGELPLIENGKRLERKEKMDDKTCDFFTAKGFKFQRGPRLGIPGARDGNLTGRFTWGEPMETGRKKKALRGPAGVHSLRRMATARHTSLKGGAEDGHTSGLGTRRGRMSSDC